MAKNLAIFDFDNTLITGDSLWPYLTHAAGREACYKALVQSVWWLFLCYVAGKKVPDRRNFFKDFLLRRLLAGRMVADLSAAAARTRDWQKLIPHMAQTLRDHAAKGDTVLIASGSLNLYMPELLRDLPYDALICTDIGLIDDGVVTGRMINGNCVRERKAERVAAWLADNGPFDEIWAYGNYPHDLPMMQLAKHRVIVS